ncbi:MAG: hypothetical protein QW165_01285 [Candidatus Woesearchaeota archaeon]
MKQVLFFVLLLLVACAPAAPLPPKTTAPPSGEPAVTAQEEVVSPPQELPPAVITTGDDETPLVSAGRKIDPYSELGCGQLLTAQEFADACGKDPASFLVTHKTGTRNCYVNAKDYQDNRLTAGVSLTGFKDAFEAREEFDRRLVVLKVGADKSVGERAYTFPKADRHIIYFVRNHFIVEVGADTRLCSKDDLLNVARIVDSHLN